MSPPGLLAVEGLSVHIGNRALLRELSFVLQPGETLTLLGESGAGKSLLAQAIMGNLPASLRASGTVHLGAHSSPAAQTADRRACWGRALTLLPQEPAQALNPLMRIEAQLAEVHSLVRGSNAGLAAQATRETLAAAGLSAAATQFPWQLSGGMAQRAAGAIALAGGARILLADEPTKGLDAYWRDRTVAMLQAAQRAGACVVVITHDLQVARALGGQLIVLRAGEVVEQGATQAVLDAPAHAFTRELLAADPAQWPRRPAPARGAQVLQAQGLSKSFAGRSLFHALDLQLHAGERLVLQGPSGTGKSTLGNVLIGLLPADEGALRRAPGLARTAIQKLYQDPVAAFAPQLRLEQALRDVARLHGRAWSDLQGWLERMGIGQELLARRPAEVSGGELQRVALARALAVRPALLFADEPTSRLDPLSQQQAMTVLLDALESSGAGLMLVTHDDALAAAVGTRFLRLDGTGTDDADGRSSAQTNRLCGAR